MSCLRARWLTIGTQAALVLTLLQSAPAAIPIVEPGRDFSTPDAAVEAVFAAAKSRDRVALRTVFGLAADDLVAADQVQASNELAAFSVAFEIGHRLVRESDARCVLEVGPDAWPFPIPIVQQNGSWRFDTEAGKEELLNRRIGRNELTVLRVMRAYVEAQREYAGRDRDGDEVLEYAPRLVSSPGTTDGLFWPPDLNGEISPLGPLVARAQAEGYPMEATGATAAREPFHGYYFKILERQGKHAPGGKYHYVINGNMIGGFALIAWPANYGESGVMTFMVNQQGRVYQQDLGTKTPRIAPKISAYDPDPSWQISPD